MTKYKSDNAYNRTMTLTGHSEMEIAPDIVGNTFGGSNYGRRLISNTGRCQRRISQSIIIQDTSTNGNTDIKTSQYSIDIGIYIFRRWKAN